MNARAVALAALVAASALTVVAPTATAASPQGAPDASIDYTGDELSLTAGSAQAITGEADLRPGSEVTVRVYSTHSPAEGFIEQRTVTVDRDGRFYALFDFADVSPNATADVVVTNDAGTQLTTANATFTECTVACDTPDDSSGGSSDDSLSLSFDNLAVEEEAVGPAGGVVRVTVALGDADAATVSIGGRAVGYELNAVVSDGNGDDRVDLAFNTSATGESPSVRPVEPADSASVTADGDLPDRATRLAAGQYPVTLYRGESASGDPVDTGTVKLTSVDTDQWGGEADEKETEPAPNVGFGEASVTAEAGSTATLALEVAEENSTVVVEGDHGYALTATAVDGDDDGRVVVRLDTTVTDGETPASAVGSADSVTVESVSVPANATTNGSLTPGAYTSMFYPGASTDSDPSDIGVLYVEASSRSSTSQSGGSDGLGGAAPEVALGAGALAAAGGVGLLAGSRR